MHTHIQSVKIGNICTTWETSTKGGLRIAVNLRMDAYSHLWRVASWNQFLLSTSSSRRTGGRVKEGRDGDEKCNGRRKRLGSREQNGKKMNNLAQSRGQCQKHRIERTKGMGNKSSCDVYVYSRFISHKQMVYALTRSRESC